MRYQVAIFILVGILLTAFTGTAAKPEDFGSLNTEHANIYYQSDIGKDRAKDVGEAIESAYRIVGEDLAFSDQRPRLYIYNSEDELFQDLTDRWGFSSEWVNAYKAVPRMNKDYVEWLPPNPNWHFIAHEYTHRIIEQIAGTGSQSNYKWFDEGLADYEGLKVLAIKSSKSGDAMKKNWFKQVQSAALTDKIISFRKITMEDDWVAQGIGPKSGLNYMQSYIAVDYLINKYGIGATKRVLTKIGQGTSFSQAFEESYGMSVDEFEREFVQYLKQWEEKKTKSSCFLLDGRTNDWQKYSPIIVDNPHKLDFEAADIREVYATTCQDSLYVMIKTALPAKNSSVVYCFFVDVNGDTKPEFQVGFDKSRAWIWNLKEKGLAAYDDINNMIELDDYDIALDEVAEFRVSLKHLDDATNPKISVWTVIDNKQINPTTAWGVVTHADLSSTSKTPVQNASVSTQKLPDNQNNTPGFEILGAILSMVILLLLKKERV